MSGIPRARKIVSTIVTLLLVVSVFTGCGVRTSTGGTQGESKPRIAFYAFNSTPVLDWDPAVEFSNGVIVLHNVYETLLRYNSSENKFIPVLATDYQKSEDGLTWTFHIRKGVKFHDGTQLNAEAVKFSIKRTMDLGKGAAFIWDPVKEINLKDEYTVELKLKYPAPMDLVASSAYGAFIVSPEAVKSHPGDWLSQGNEAGTGPYKLKSFQLGEEVALEKFGDYWQGWGSQHFDNVVIKKIPETATRRQLVEKGDADITIELPYEDIEALKKNRDVNVTVGPSFENLFMMFNTDKAPLDNKLVRQALSYAFPYDAVVKYSMGSFATQARGAVPFGLWGHGKDLFQYQYDLDKAKELLAKSGHPNGGFKLLLTYMSGDEAEKKAAELYKAELAKLNIELEIRGMPWEAEWEQAKSPDPKKRQDIFTFYWWPDVPSPYTYLFNMFHTQKEILFNLAYWENEEFDKLVDTAAERSGVDRAKAEELYVQAQEVLLKEAPALFVYDKQYVRILNKSFKGYKDNPAYPHVVFFYDTYREQ